MIGFLCKPMSLFYAFIGTLRRGPDSSPDSLGLQDPKMVRKATSSFPGLSSADRLPVSSACPWRASAGTSCRRRVASSLPGSPKEENQFLQRDSRGSWPSLLFSRSHPPKIRREISLNYQESSLFWRWLWTYFEVIWAPRSEHTGA